MRAPRLRPPPPPVEPAPRVELDPSLCDDADVETRLAEVLFRLLDERRRRRVGSKR